MQIAVYVIYELLVRLEDLNPGIGNYLKNKTTTNGILVHTTTGQISIPAGILLRQFNDPTTITQHELLDLLDSFKESAQP